jgi:hypothetical protein
MISLLSFRTVVLSIILRLLCSSFGASASCPSVDIRVLQNVTGLLTTANPVASAQTVEEFYDYRARSFHGDLPVAGDTSLITIHQDSTTCQLSLVIVHSAIFQGAFGSASMFINGDLWNPLVKDDAEYVDLVFHDDLYDDHSGRKLGYTLTQWHWHSSDTDGLAMPFVEGWEGCLIVEANFRIISAGIPNGQTIKKWKYVSFGGVTTDLDLFQTLYICLPGGDEISPGKDPFPRTDVVGACAEIGSSTEPFCNVCTRYLCHWHILCNLRRVLICIFGWDIPLIAGNV